MSATIEKVVESVLIQNNIKNYDKKDLELQLQIHPSYPSFQSITDTLDYFNIDNIAVEVPAEALDQLPESFVSLITTEQGEEIVSILKNKDHIHLKQTSLKKKKHSFEEFKKLWVPKVIAVEYNTKQKLVSSTQTIFQNILLTILGLGLLFSFYNKTWDITQISFLMLSISGTIFSFFALRESLGIQSQTMHEFCTSIGNSSCNDVINNSGSKLFKAISLADASMIFFSSITIYQLLYGFDTSLLIPSLLGIPVILYSIYSQALVIKKWCAICLAIGSISLGLAIIGVLNTPFNLHLDTIVNLIIISSLTTLLYFFTKKKVEENNKYKGDNLKLNQFKRDEQIYNHLLSLSEKVDDNIAIANEIVLGNPNAKFKIIALSNPMCGYCKDAFEAYTRVLKTLGDKLQISIRFNVNIDDPNNQAHQIVLILFEIYRNHGAEAFIDAYNKWFTNRTHSKWIKTYGTPQQHPEIKEVLTQQSKWAEKHTLYYTPASLVNDTIYPQKYSYDEFFHFMNMMTENYSDSKSESPEAIEA